MHKLFPVLPKFQTIKIKFPGVALALVFCLFAQGINNVFAIEVFGTPKVQYQQC